MPDTVISAKEAFISSQVRLLSRPLELPPNFEQSSEISDRILEHVMRETNRIFARHNKSVYDDLAVRTLAEQIDTLYWDSAAPNLANDVERWYDEGTIKKDDDLTDEKVIERLDPASFSTEELSALAEQLKSLSSRRAEARQKLAQYKRLQEEIAPLKDAQASVQPSLVTRDGPVAEELSRSKMTSIRVAGRAAGVKRTIDEASLQRDFNVRSTKDKVNEALGIDDD